MKRYVVILLAILFAKEGFMSGSREIVDLKSRLNSNDIVYAVTITGVHIESNANIQLES
jgi:hypothetical protein